MAATKYARALIEGGSLFALFGGVIGLVIWLVVYPGSPADLAQCLMPAAIGGVMAGVGVVLERFAKTA
jgi:hypothetical protein